MQSTLQPDARKLAFLPLVAATYFMVCGGPYGIEDILGGAGFGWAIVILLVLPFFWCLPTGLMIGELATALPEEGGYYLWVRRALGPFWGYQESWLSLSASVFDMAIYPALFVLYLSKFNPSLTAGSNGYLWSLALVVVCCAWNLRGASVVGEGSVALCVVLLAPIAVFVMLGLRHGFYLNSALHPALHWRLPAAGVTHSEGFSTAILVAMWNYMGWDNASTVAQEVENPQRNYPRTMLVSMLLVLLTYILPLAAMAASGLSVDHFSTGDWATAARNLGGAGWLGTSLGLAVVLGGMISGVGMFNALMMSYTRLPMAMADDGLLPRVLSKRNHRGVPWVSVLLCGTAWALALKLPFERLISIDLVLYGSSLLLEFVALIALRLREPELPRPFKAGNLAVTVLLGVGPAALIGFALYASRDEKLAGSISALLFAAVVALLGPLLYWLSTTPSRRLIATEAASIAD